jgi:hypothetical protein
MTVTPIHRRNTDPHAVIATLEELLGRAKAGEFVALATVCVRPDGTFCTKTSGFNTLELAGALACAQRDVIEAGVR